MPTPLVIVAKRAAKTLNVKSPPKSVVPSAYELLQSIPTLKLEASVGQDGTSGSPFETKHFDLIEGVAIGRHTSQKTLPTPRNGYFDSKVLSRQHAKIYAEKEKVGDAQRHTRSLT